MKKYSAILAATAPAAVVSASWWNGAPECAQSCLSAAWTDPTGTITSWWPQQTEYCGDAAKGSSIGGCITSACNKNKKDKTAWPSYSALSSSLCSRYASCTDAGSTGVQTLTYAGGPVTWAAPGGWEGKFREGKTQQDDSDNSDSGDGSDSSDSSDSGDSGDSGNGDNSGSANNAAAGQWGGPNGTAYSQYWSDWASAYSGSKTWSGGVVTVTGCAFDGSPWFVGPSCGWNGLGGFNGFVGWGSGWSWGPTETKTVTVTTTDKDGHETVETGLGTLAVAVSGTLTTSSLVGALAQATGGSTDGSGSGDDGNGSGSTANAAAPRGEGSIVTVLMGFGLGAVLAVAGML
ncbi:hypothetical protein F4777DRAFT_39734 [Nemania sp. FL0916]|nr:hypothetical protein F4777DRAFT_39734 [Nemania sp. FL0916]